jgi:hypothetical protein
MMRPARDLVTFGLDWLLAAIMLAMVGAAFMVPALYGAATEDEPRPPRTFPIEVLPPEPAASVAQ